MRPADRDWMAVALALARRARPSPNPKVGAVVIKGRRVVGQGFHRGPGRPHAEVLALQAAGRYARGATLYVTLEPCCHEEKRTPPCVPLILARGIRRVVAGVHDPNPHVAGRGVAQLKQAGLAVLVGVCEEEAWRLNEPYFTWVTRGRPYVTLKIAQTLDGKIATSTGESRWISGEAARRVVHRLRHRVDAILVGIGTVLADDPLLTPRSRGGAGVSGQGRQPFRVVVDSHLRIPTSARVFRAGPPERLLIATTEAADPARRAAIHQAGAQLLLCPSRAGRVDLPHLFRALGARGILSLLIEGGSEINAAALEEGLVDHLLVFISPRILGGRETMPAVGGRSPVTMAEALSLHDVRLRRVGPDVLIEGKLGEAR